MKYSQDRPTFRAIVVSATGGAFDLLGISRWSTSKTDDSSAGSFHIEAPLVPNLGLAQKVAPQDIVAIFASRSWLDSQGTPHAPWAAPASSVGNLANLVWGQLSTIEALGNDPTCVFIGLVDSAICDGDADRASYMLDIDGRDLTKMLIETDVMVPQIAAHAASNVGAVGTLDVKAFQALANITITNENSGTGLLLDLLDRFVAKIAERGSLPANVAASIASFGFPWRQWFRIDLLDPSFKHAPLASSGSGPDAGVTLRANVEAGSAWSNVLEVANKPFTRLFVNEIAQLVFDDPLPAWTTATPTLAIGADDLRSFRTWRSDGDVVTFLTIYANRALNGSGLKKQGAVDDGFTSFVDGTSEAAMLNGDVIKKYGARFLVLYSNFDTTFEDAAKRFPLIVFLQNNMWHAHAVVRGLPIYRAGKRYQINFGMVPDDVQNATWYATSVEHQADFEGADWTTSLELRFPLVSGASPPDANAFLSDAGGG